MINLLFSCVLAASCVSDFTPNYPTAPKEEVVDDYHGTKVQDPYRSLEVSNENWLNEEKSLTDQYFSRISFKEKIFNRLKTLYNYQEISTPFTVGDNLLFLERNVGDLQAKLVLQGTNLGDGETKETLFDPTDFDRSGLTSINGVYPSFNGKYVAVTLSKSGTDQSTIRIIDVDSKSLLDLEIKDVSYPTLAWSGNGFYYTGLTKHKKYTKSSPKERANPSSSKTDNSTIKNRSNEQSERMLNSQSQNANTSANQANPKKQTDKTNQTDQVTISDEIRLDTTLVSPAVFYRSLNSKKDLLIYKDEEHPDQFFSIESKKEGSYLILSITDSSSNGNALYYLMGSKKFKPIVSGYEHNVELIDIIEGSAFVLRNNQIVSIDMQNPQSMETVYIDPQKILQSVSYQNGFLFATYYRDAKTYIEVIKKSGKVLHNIDLPGIGVVSGFDGNLYYSYTSTLSPSKIYKYDFATKDGELVYEAKFNFPFSDYETYQVFYESADGTKIPMIITHKKGLKKDGSNPTLLAGYGGFSVSYIPRFSPSKLLFLEQGGIYAVANIRGGGEYGESWHEAGMLQNKQNVFEDFFAACNFLIQNKYTTSENLAVTGGSNGGLLMGAVITQKPGLCGTVISRVGLYDMLRFHKFSIGWHWTAEYGSSENPAQFTTLFQYSPLHNVRKEKYPATLILTGDHDDRVLPIHSYKFTAALQDNQVGKSPILLKVFENTGHGRGKPLNKILYEESLFWSFLFCNTVGEYHFTP